MKETIKATFKYNKKLFVKFFVSFAVCAIGIVLSASLFAISSRALPSEVVPNGGRDNSVLDDDGNVINETPVPEESSALYDLIGVDGSQPLEIILLITLLSVAPSILLMMTSFTRIIIIFGFLRNAMNTQSTPPNQVLVGLALFLTIYIMAPVFVEINRVAYVPYANGELTAWEALEEASKPLEDFMLRNTNDESLAFFMDLSKTELVDSDGEPLLGENIENISIERRHDVGLHVIVPAFMISELSHAFKMGFILFIPFLVIDIVVSSTLMSMGMMMLPPAMISLPFKIIFFVLVDGWQLLVGTLIESFNV